MSQGRQGIFVIFLLFMVGAFLLVIGGRMPFANTSASQESNERAVTVENIAENPIIFRELVVEVDGQLTDWVTRRSFILGSDGGLGSDKVLVLQQQEFDLPRRTPENKLALGEKTDVTVRGEVQLFQQTRLENELGLDLTEEALEEWEEKPVLIVERIQKH